MAKDPSGIPLLHKAVYNDHQDVVEWLIQNYPMSVNQKDRVSIASNIVRSSVQFVSSEKNRIIYKKKRALRLSRFAIIA